VHGPPPASRSQLLAKGAPYARTLQRRAWGRARCSDGLRPSWLSIRTARSKVPVARALRGRSDCRYSSAAWMQCVSSKGSGVDPLLRRPNASGPFLIGAVTEEERRASGVDLLPHYLAHLEVPAERPHAGEAQTRYPASAAHGLAIWLSTFGTDGFQSHEVSLAWPSATPWPASGSGRKRRWSSSAPLRRAEPSAALPSCSGPPGRTGRSRRFEEGGRALSHELDGQPARD
jgi:hypothetical protein